MPNVSLSFDMTTLNFVIEVAKKEYPKNDPRLLRHKRPNEPFSELAKTAILKEAVKLAKKHHVEIPPKLQKEEDA